MIKNPENDPWSIIDDELQVNNRFTSEKIFSLGNGQIGQRASFEEYFSGETILGSHIYGSFNTDNKGLSNWEKEFSETTDEIINAPNWIGIIVRLNEEVLDLATWEVLNFESMLNMLEGILERSFDAISLKGNHIHVSVKRFLSMAETEVGAISYSIKSLNFEGRISFMPILDGEMAGQFQNNEPIWNVLQTRTQKDVAHLWTQTRRTDFHVCQAMTYVLYKNNEQLNILPSKIEKEKIAGFSVGTDVKRGDTISLNKYVAIVNSLNHDRKELTETACNLALASRQKGWNKLFEEHSAILTEMWNQSEELAEASPQSLQENHYRLFRKFLGLDNQVLLSVPNQ